MNFAETLSAEKRRKARIDAILSTIFGTISEQAIDTNTLLILYLMLLGGGDSFSMLSTAIVGLCGVFLSIPSAGIVNKLGLRLSYSTAIYLQVTMLACIAGAPFFGSMAPAVVMSAFAVYCILRSLYAATWFPLLDNFLLAEERGRFFGNMRFIYMIFNMLLIFSVGFLMGEKPPLWIIQLYFVVAGAGLLWRKIFLDRLPYSCDVATTRVEILPALKISLANSALVGFSFYLGFLTLAALSAFPLAVVYMKSCLGLGAQTIMIITSLGIGGQIAAYGAVGFLMKNMPRKYFTLMIHLIFLLVIGGLLLTSPEQSWNSYLLGVLFFFNGMAAAFLNCLASTEMLSLARPGNKVMAMAFTTTFQSIGNAVGRLGMTLLMASGMLAPVWQCGNRSLTYFHTLFIFSFVMTLLGLLFLVLTPAMVPERSDYYAP